ncbi:CmcJ/NvfI family oxidoreductase [uncultured Sphingomonas sp.]|uniref:CmcJ/NvfI family oxidoreductase n=1 Tax=uncultured Sphingomonas sp. TaxID=158754 RepID=UPI0035CBC077
MTEFPTGDVTATFDYLRDPPTDDPDAPLCYYTEDRSKTTMRVVPVQMPIVDGRPRVASFSLDREGFELVPHRSAITDFMDRAQLETVYPDEAAELIRNVTGAFFAVGLGVGVRFGRKRTDYVKAGDDQPARFPHADFTDETSQTILDQVGETLDGYSRCALYNVWRVFSDPPQDFPLAVCDARTASPADEASAEAILDLPGSDEPFRSMTTVYRPNGANRWTYFSNMTVDEALVFKAWDSDKSRSQRVPHSSFANPLTGPDAPSRSSIESRVLAYFA